MTIRIICSDPFISDQAIVAVINRKERMNQSRKRRSSPAHPKAGLRIGRLAFIAAMGMAAFIQPWSECGASASATTVAAAGIASSASSSEPSGNSLPVASRSVRVAVPDGMNTSPFDVPRMLAVPQGFAIAVFARVDNARFMAVAPNGDLMVSNPEAGKVILLRANGKAAPRQFDFASGLQRPHDIVFHTSGKATYIYIAESNRIIRAPYTPGQTGIGAVQTVVANLPDASSKELKGHYGHQLKNIALNGNKLYVSIASTCNACESDTVSDPIRSAIYEYDADGKNRRLYAQGLRNAEGIRFKPGTNELWAVVNSRDNIAYPYHKDWNGDGSDDFGKVMQSYVDGHPPDLLVKVKDGGRYGWPFCNSNPDAGLDNMPYDRDAQLNPDGSMLDCDKIDRVAKGIPAHSAALGMSFLQNSGFPEMYRNALVTALHGCWNCSSLNGHKIALYPFKADGGVGDEVDLVTGWVTDAKAKKRWGRPVDAVPDGKGGLYISDDDSGTIYLLASPSK
ncbi:MAG: sugar dehydrogenase [Herminiimonas sp.]|nr:sugar dehydrogenase [Herminiimonas sp.]